MKKLLLICILGLFATSATAQYEIPKSVTEDKALSKYVFSYINEYRETVSQKPYVWTDFWYLSAKRWNDEVSKTGTWGHNRGPAWENFHGEELIVAIPIISDEDFNYKFIADSALNCWLHSKWHHDGITAPLMEKLGDTSTQQFGDTQLSGVLLCKYGAISANVLQYENHKMVYIIFHKGFYPASTNRPPL